MKPWFTAFTLMCVLVQIRALENWPNLQFETEVAIRTQRDISYPVPIDQATHFGVSLSRLLFDPHGYVESASSLVRTLLNVGVKILTIDLYWNQYTSKWQLCPAPYPTNSSSDIDQIRTVYWNNKNYTCQPSFSVNHILSKVVDFFDATNTNMNANYVQILLRLNGLYATPSGPRSGYNSTRESSGSYYSENSEFGKLGNSTLSEIANNLGSHLFTPKDLDTYRDNQQDKPDLGRNFYNQSGEAFPSLYDFIFTEIKRTTVTIIYDEVSQMNATYNVSKQDKENIFMNDESVNINVLSLNDKPEVDLCLQNVFNLSTLIDSDIFDNISLTSHYRYVYDGVDGLKFNNLTFRGLIRCGYSPILNSSEYQHLNDLGDIINTVIPISFWSWSDLQQISLDNATDNDLQTSSLSTLDHDNDRTQEAFKCVVVTQQGWGIANCYERYQYACQHDDLPNEWMIKPEKKQYFQAYSKSSCPENYSLGTPRLSIEMLALMYAVDISEDGNFPVWIDVNDITVTNCFVTGGPYADCPYQRTVSSRALAGLLAPSAVIAAFVLFLVFLENAIRSNPIQSNRKRFWKKRINEYYEKHDYDGVPS